MHPLRTPNKLLVGGQLLSSNSRLNVVNPATENVFCVVPEADKGHLDVAISLAKKSFPKWATSTLHERQEALAGFLSALESSKDELAKLLTLEQGKPLAQAIQELEYSFAFLSYFLTIEHSDRTLTSGVEGTVKIQFKPMGIVAAIVPWNFPILLTMFKLGPALLAGNCVIVKTAPTTPLTLLRISEIAAEFFPDGVLSILPGGDKLGETLTQNPAISKIAFTGSTQAGRSVMRSASANLARLTLELGGNDPAIVLEDADVAVVAPEIFQAAFLNAGQTCVAVKRVYVHQSLYADFLEAMSQCLASAPVGDGMNPDTLIGPVQNARQKARLDDLASRAYKDAEVTTYAPDFDRGFFVKPSILSEVDDANPIISTEQFGPILPILSFDNEDEALSRANKSEYGLASSIWSSDVERAQALSVGVQAGTVWINQHLALQPNVPLEGVKSSGFGAELGQESIERFSLAQVVSTKALEEVR